jgi:hypothetical protein
MLYEIYDDDSANWILEAVIHHRVIMKPRNKLMVKVTWKYHPPSCLDGNALQLQSPLLIVKYVKDKHLQEYPEFTWTKGIMIDNTTDLRNVYAATSDGPKHKFGELVPKNARHAMNIDRTNGITAWQDVIDTKNINN